MTGTFFKRVLAYIFDVVLLSLLGSLLSFLPILNPNRVTYSEKYNELVMVREQYVNNEISVEEYEQAYIPIAYQIYQLNTYAVIIDIVCVLLYFGIFQFFFQGQTLGKKIFQVRVVGSDGGSVTLVQFLLRTIVLSNILISIMLLLIVHFMNAENYYSIYNNVNLVGSIILYITLFMALVRRDGRGLHDFVGNTKVILCSDEVKEKKEKVKEEQKVLESEFEGKRKRVSKKASTKKKKVLD